MKKSYTINDLSTYELYRKIKSRDFMNKYINEIETKKSVIKEDYDNCNCLKLLKEFFINLI